MAKKKIKRLKPRMSEEELKNWYDRRKKTHYHKSKKDYIRKNKLQQKEFEYWLNYNKEE